MRIWIAALVAMPIVAAAQRTALPAARIPDCLGVNIHFTRTDDKQLNLLADGGFRFIRMDFAWSAIERERGKYDFADYDFLIDALAKRRIRPLFILDYSNKLYEPTDSVRSDEGRAAYARWAAASAKRYAGRGVIWEIWNEPNGVFWHPQPGVDDYSRLAVEAARAIRQADSGAFIVAPATSGVDFGFLERFFKNGGLSAIDAVTVHPYRTGPPESASNDYAKLRTLIEHYGKPIDILSGEWGYSDVWGGFTPEQQGRYLARQWLANLENDVRLSIWYDWRDDGPDPKEAEHHFGTVTRDLAPKPAYKAAKTLTHELAGYEYFATAIGPDHTIILRSGSRFVLAYWSERDDAPPQKVWVNTPTRKPRPLRQISAFGEPSAVNPDKLGWAELKPTQLPQYLFLGERPSPALKWRIREHELPIKSGRPAQLRVEIWNDSDVLQNVLLLHNTTEASQQEKQTLKPGWNVFPLEFTLARRDRELVPLTVTLEMRDEDGKRMDLGARQAIAIVSDPLKMEVVPTIDGAALQVEQPYSEGFIAATVSVRRERVVSSAWEEFPFRVKDHGPSYVRLGASSDADPFWAVRLSDANTKRLIGMAEGRFRLVESFAKTVDGWQISFDGDGKLKGEATQSVVKAPDDGGLRLERGLRIDYRFDPGWKFWMLHPPKSQAPIFGRPRAVGIWIYGDGKMNQLRCRFRDATGQTFQPTFGQIDWKGWRYVTMELTGGWHWGGANDGAVHYPIEWDSPVLLDSASTTAETSTIFIGPIHVVY